MRRMWIFMLVGFLGLALVPSSARGQANFYEGKTVTVVIGAKSGSLAIAAQIVAHHLGKYIPGNPTVIVQQMPGAAHLLATNHIFNAAKPDGLTLLAANPNVAIAQLSKVEQVRFDVRKFQWLGSSGADGVMIGRGAYGRPWLLAQVMSELSGGGHRPDPSLDEQLATMLEQYDDMLSLYGRMTGVNLARKHIGWYTKGLPGSAEMRNRVNCQDDPAVVTAMLREFYSPWLSRSAA